MSNIRGKGPISYSAKAKYTRRADQTKKKGLAGVFQKAINWITGKKKQLIIFDKTKQPIGKSYTKADLTKLVSATSFSKSKKEGSAVQNRDEFIRALFPDHAGSKPEGFLHNLDNSKIVQGIGRAIAEKRVSPGQVKILLDLNANENFDVSDILNQFEDPQALSKMSEMGLADKLMSKLGIYDEIRSEGKPYGEFGSIKNLFSAFVGHVEAKNYDLRKLSNLDGLKEEFSGINQQIAGLKEEGISEEPPQEIEKKEVGKSEKPSGGITSKEKAQIDKLVIFLSMQKKNPISDKLNASDEEKLKIFSKITYLKISKPIDIPNGMAKLMPNLKSLDLSGCGLTEVPKEVFEFKNLINLNLKNNKIKELPEEIGNLRQLTNLDLNHNEIKKLPKEIGNLRQLTNLDLNHNEIKKLPKEIGNLTLLTELSLVNNKLDSIPSEIGKLDYLKYIYAPNNSISSLPEEIGNLKSLESLYLEGNSLKELPASITNLNLSFLNLSRNEGLQVSNEIKEKFKNINIFNI